MNVAQICSLPAPMVVGAPPAGPDTPTIMHTPPKNGNPGIVPPWLQQAREDYALWKDMSTDWTYQPGSYPFDYGMTVEDVAAMYRQDWPSKG